MSRMAFEDSSVIDGEAEDAQRFDSRAARKASRAGLGFLGAAVAIAAMWFGACATAAMVLLGVEALAALSRLQMIGLALFALLPASLILFCGMAAREGARARAEARRLADAADRMLNPSATARNAASRVGAAVRHEINELDRALAGVLAKLRETQTAVSQQSTIVDAAADRARIGAQNMIFGMDRERDALVQIAADLNAQASLIGDQISRHARVLADAAQTAETEVRLADHALDQRLNAFNAATSLIGDRTHALHAAAQASADSALRLESALSGALDVLAKATSLTDAARQNADQATRAADATAGAVRDTTARAIDDAKHAADLIRAEAAAMEREAARAIERLREAAFAARSASEDVRAAAGVAMAANLEARQAPAPPPEGPQRPRMMDRRASAPTAPIDEIDAAWAALERDAAAPAPGAATDAATATRAAPTVAAAKSRRPSFAEQLSGVAFGRAAPSPQAHAQANAPANTNAVDGRRDRHPDRHQGGGWRWRDMLAVIDGEDRKAGAPERRPQEPRSDAERAGASASRVITPAPNAFETPFTRTLFEPAAPAGDTRSDVREPAMAEAGVSLSARSQQSASIVGYARHPLPIVQVLDRAGLPLSKVFGPDSLDRIAHRARNGTQARRRAVREAAPEAVARLEAALRGDAGARIEANTFLRSEGARIAELLGRGRAAMTADATRAFLLLDAAST
jgi:hypothetical protein